MKILLLLLITLILTSCSKCEPTVITEIKYVPQIVEKVVVVQCKIDIPLCDRLNGKLDEKLFTSIKCITDLKMYMHKCNED